MKDFKGQCFCYPSKEHGECEHCNRARCWVQRDILVLANELGEEMIQTDIDAIENLWEIPEHCDEAEPQDIMQWYIVSKWLYDKLRNSSEPVADYKGQYWWGRTCCGQAIELDGTFQEISRNL